MNKIIASKKRKTAPIISFFLSILLVGLGQIVNGQVKKGILMLLFAFLVNIICFVTKFEYMVFIQVLLFLWSGYDAYKLTKALKKGKVVKEFTFF